SSWPEELSRVVPARIGRAPPRFFKHLRVSPGRRAPKTGRPQRPSPTIFVETPRMRPRPGRIRATRERPEPMNRLLRPAGLVLAGGLCACGGKASRPAHEGAAATPAPAPPTPDTTPIEALRTPAGLVLKIDQPTPVVTPAPATTPAP